MSRSASSFLRRGARFRPQPRVLVICEDTKSAKTYLEDAAIDFRARAVVEFSHCGRTDPLGIVEAAIKRQSDFEYVYCVIDRDAHLNFDEAIGLAAVEPKVKVISSFPCFEFWLLLHFGYTRSPYEAVGKHSAADRVIQELRTKDGMGGYAKGAVNDLYKKLSPMLPDARRFSARTLVDAAKDDELNPSSSLLCFWINLRNCRGPSRSSYYASLVWRDLRLAATNARHQSGKVPWC